MKSIRKILLAFDAPYQKPSGYDFKEEFRQPDWKTERCTHQALVDSGFEVRLVGLYNDIKCLIDQIEEFKPDIVFNLTEVFGQRSNLEKNIPWLLEILGVPYTGASPASLLICNDKALNKKILTYHKIKVPHFHTFYRNRKVWKPGKLRFPIIIKPLCEEASRGISQASLVEDEKAFIERVRFIHESMKLDAIAEEYIPGREFYISIIGHKRLTALPPREMIFGEQSPEEPKIATYKAKWDDGYRKKWKIRNTFARNLAPELQEKITDVCKRAYRALNLQCYARFDVRVTEHGRVFIIEPNANPSLQKDDELAMAAERIGLNYEALINKIIRISAQRSPRLTSKGNSNGTD